MSVKELKTYFISSLKQFISIKRSFVLLQFTRRKINWVYQELQLRFSQKKQISEKEKFVFDNAISRLKNFEPIQHILGTTEFFGLPFLVDKNVLIPRPETEELVAWIADEAQNENIKKLSILDIGTGSGCIAISLANQLPKTIVGAI